MRGAVLYGPYDVRLEERPAPTIVKPTDAVLRLSATCICGSDLWPYRGLQPVAAVSRSSAEPFSREEVSRRIENAAREALSGLADMRVADITPPPFRFALTFQDEQQPQAVAWLRGAEPASDPATIQIRAGDFEEGYRRSLEMIRAAGLVSRVQALQRVMNSQPNREGMSRAVSQYVDDRWLNLLPPPKPPAGAAAPPRYWGAR